MTHLCSQTIYITCPVHPEVLYANLISAKEGAKAQLMRRITEVRHFGDEPAAMVADFDAGF